MTWVIILLGVIVFELFLILLALHED